jgi:hydrogenase nickel incorporation protein HypB
MCDTCGCNITPANAHLVKKEGKLEHTSDGTASVEVLTSLLHENDHQAEHNREHFNRHGMLAVNLMSSPGSGKTSLLEATIEALGGEFSIAVVEGDLETENDADIDSVDILFIENVGNLVCPASFDLGHHVNVTLLSVTEGDDKPAKYPVMFRAADLVLLSKSDFLEMIDDFDPDKAERHVRELANPAEVLTLSVRRPETLEAWFDWLRRVMATREKGEELNPSVQPDGAALHLTG